MIIYMDIDGTICHTDQSLPAPQKYEQARPIPERIAKVNALYDAGHRITFWTARGNTSQADYMGLTMRQLEAWGCKYHSIKTGKPSYDLFVDDKACDCDVWLPVPAGGGLKDSHGNSNPTPAAIAAAAHATRVSKPTQVPKGWGHELVIANSPKYCGKILHFHTGGMFSMHYHILKEETWYVASGRFRFRYIDTATATLHETTLSAGDVVTNAVGQPHQLICEAAGEIFETSTEHFDSDSYRIFKGDSQHL